MHFTFPITYRFLLAVPPLVFLALFYFYPLFNIIGASFFPAAGSVVGKLKMLFASGYYPGIVWFTFWQAALSTLLTLAAALPGAYFFTHYRFRGKSIFRALATVPFVLPAVVVGAAFQSLLGPRGIVNDLLRNWELTATLRLQLNHSIWLILLAHVFYNYAVVFRIVGSAWANLEQRTSEAARMLGASPRRTFFTITLPQLYPAILAAAALVFIFCFSSFGVILILGGPRFATIETAIYHEAVHLFNLPMAAVLSLIQIAFTFGIMGVYTRIQKHAVTSVEKVASALHQHTPANWLEKSLLAANLTFMAFLLGAPMLALLLKSISTPSGISLAYYAALFRNPTDSIFFIPPIKAIFFSITAAGAAMVSAVVMGLLAATYLSRSHNGKSTILDPIFMLPLSTSAVTLGFGFILTLDKPPLNLRASLAIVPIAHTLVAFPFVVRSILPALRSLPQRLRDAATLLGASPWKVWRAVDLPIAGRVLLVGAVFAFTVSLGEFGATAFIARPQMPTMPVAIYRFLGQPGPLNYGQAMAMSSILMLVTACGFLMIEKFRIGGIGEF